MKRIQRLSAHTVGQIAAGEVIERPASVLKELLENSQDAGATQITVRLAGAGRQLIEVVDNGHGIESADLSLALTNHATSKIDAVADLWSLQTLGFRGEALASMASVAQVELASRPATASMGHAVGVSDGQMDAVVPVAMAPGTRVRVRDLFYCVPVRQQFLKSPKTEGYHLEQAFKRAALAHFQARYQLISDDRVIYTLPVAQSPAEQLKRLEKLLGHAFLKHAYQLEFATDGLRLHGWIVDHAYHRGGGQWQYMYLNGRYVRDPSIQHAIRQAYHTFNDAGQPAYVLYLHADVAAVDVNVHPEKTAVRLLHARQIHDFLVACLRRAWQHDETPLDDDQETPVAYQPPSKPISQSLTTVPASENKPVPQCLAVLCERFAFIDHQGTHLLDLTAVRRTLDQQQLERAWARHGVITGHPLLIPQVVTLTAAQHQQVLACSHWSTLGVDLTALHAHDVVIRQAPTILAGLDLSDWLHAWLAARATTLDDTLQQMVAYAAAHAVWTLASVATWLPVLIEADTWQFLGQTGCIREITPECLAELFK